jgi:hypothetical protein
MNLWNENETSNWHFIDVEFINILLQKFPPKNGDSIKKIQFNHESGQKHWNFEFVSNVQNPSNFQKKSFTILTMLFQKES